MWRAIAISDDDVDLSKAGFASILRAVAVGVDIEVAADGTALVVTIVACIYIGTCYGCYGCGIGAFRLGVTRGEVTIRFIYISRGVARWYGCRPVTVGI